MGEDGPGSEHAPGMKTATALLMAVPYLIFIVFALWFWLRRRRATAASLPGER